MPKLRQSSASAKLECPMSVSPSVAVSRVTFAAGLALAPIIAGGEAAAQSKLEASYTISFARIPVGSITATSEIDNAEYTTAMSGKASAILRVLAGGEGTLAASGRVTDGRLIPLRYQSNTTADDDTLDVTMTFEDGNVKELTASAPPPAADRVAVSEGDRRGVVDPLTALLVAAADGGDGVTESACQRTLAIFDGRRRFDLRLAFKRIDRVKAEQGYAGPAVVCAVTFQPIAGHRTSSPLVKFLSDGRDIELALAPIPGTRVLAPFRLAVTNMLGNLVVQANRFETTPRASTTTGRAR